MEIDYLGREIRADGQIVTDLTIDYDHHDSGNVSGIGSADVSANESANLSANLSANMSSNVGNRIEDWPEEREAPDKTPV